MTKRVAIISDANFYVGPALSRVLAARDHDLVLGDAGAELVGELEGLGATVVNVAGVGRLREGDTEKLLGAAVDRFGRVDAAAAFTGQIVVGRFLNSTVEDLRTVMAGCIEQPYNFLRTLVPHMADQEDGGQILVLTPRPARVRLPARRCTPRLAPARTCWFAMSRPRSRSATSR